ncbi:hypothetical protein IWQ60_009488 [Tieghemiomyces parasiticus]|uniref:Uncharacterized protein n=1 Tax=Tieghemiomyces parasiticus TaxID=78921 RepID=A0A9W7ZXI1_9FUNG|nr:hypothetical protein IWQ60_009488 [Tieghemiomyces parasiticus]
MNGHKASLLRRHRPVPAAQSTLTGCPADVRRLPYWAELTRWLSEYDAHVKTVEPATATGDPDHGEVVVTNSIRLTTRLDSPNDPYDDPAVLAGMLRQIARTLDAVTSTTLCLIRYPEIAALLEKISRRSGLMTHPVVSQLVLDCLARFTKLPPAGDENHRVPDKSHLWLAAQVRPMISARPLLTSDTLRLLDCAGRSTSTYQTHACQAMLSSTATHLASLRHGGVRLKPDTLNALCDHSRSLLFIDNGWTVADAVLQLCIAYPLTITNPPDTRQATSGYERLIWTLLQSPSCYFYKISEITRNDLRNNSDDVLTYEVMTVLGNLLPDPQGSPGKHLDARRTLIGHSLVSYLCQYSQRIRFVTQLFREWLDEGVSQVKVQLWADLFGAILDTPDGPVALAKSLPPSAGNLLAVLCTVGPPDVRKIRALIYHWHRLRSDMAPTDIELTVWLLNLSRPAYRIASARALVERRAHLSPEEVDIYLEYLSLALYPGADSRYRQALILDLDEMLSVFHDLYTPNAEFRAIVFQFLEDCIQSQQTTFAVLTVDLILYSFIPRAPTISEQSDWVHALEDVANQTDPSNQWQR